MVALEIARVEACGDKPMPISEQTAREVVAIVRKHVDQPTLDKIIEDLQEVRGDKNFRDAVELFARLIRTD
jgi:hypothetical protein